MREEEYIIYGTDTCVFCDKAKTILDHYNENWTYVNIMESPEIQKAFFKKTKDAKTVPQIFYYDPRRAYGNENMEILIGGYNELQEWLREMQNNPWKGVDKSLK